MITIIRILTETEVMIKRQSLGAGLIRLDVYTRTESRRDIMTFKHPVYYNVCNGPWILVRIHPYQQRNVAKLIEAAKDLPSIKRIYVFGSSVEDRCSILSDLDIAVEWNYEDWEEASKLRRSLGDIDVDMLDYREGDTSRVQRDIETKGVVVYDSTRDDINNPKKILHDVTEGEFEYVEPTR